MMINDGEIAAEMDRLLDSTRFGPVSEDVIAAAELEMGLSLPRSYRVFLRRFGAAICNGHEIYGLPNTRDTDEGDEDTFWTHVVDASRSMWRGYGGRGMPKHLVLIADSGGDLHYYIDVSFSNGSECPVVAWGPGAQGVVVGQNFLEFLMKIHESDCQHE